MTFKEHNLLSGVRSIFLTDCCRAPAHSALAAPERSRPCLHIKQEALSPFPAHVSYALCRKRAGCQRLAAAPLCARRGNLASTFGTFTLSATLNRVGTSGRKVYTSAGNIACEEETQTPATQGRNGSCSHLAGMFQCFQLCLKKPWRCV